MRAVRVEFQHYGSSKAPTIEYSMRHWRSGASLSEFALIDTGSSLTVFPRELLRQHGFPVQRAKQAAGGIGGIGGRAKLHYLDKAAFAVLDTEDAPHFCQLDRIHFTDALMPTILGCDLLRALNATLTLDFVDETGTIRIG